MGVFLEAALSLLQSSLGVYSAATFALMALVSFFQLYQDIRALFGKKVFEWAPVEEGIEI